MELPLVHSSIPLRKRVGVRLRHHLAGTLSLVAHLTVIGALWSAQFGKPLSFRLAGDRGSIALQASLERPQPTEQPVLERLSPVQVRIEPDHRHVDMQVFAAMPTIAEPKTQPQIVDPSDAAPNHTHPHAHPHHHAPHTHPTDALTQSVAADSAAASAAGHEKLPAPFDNPPPEYPVEAYRAKLEGTALVRIGIRADGTVEFVEVAQTSGHELLDAAAVRALRGWRFTPGLNRGVPVPFVLRLPIVFKL